MSEKVEMAGEESRSAPLMIVGASRSGTAMLRTILNRHKQVCLSGETHYFDDLRIRLKNPDKRNLTPEENKICSNYFRALDDRPYGMSGNPSRSPIDEKEFIRRASGVCKGTDGFFEMYCKISAEREGKVIWGEKTPRHVFRIHDILERYPESKVICMVRDPRGVVASYRDWKNQGGLNYEGDQDYGDAIKAEENRSSSSYNIIIATLLWRAAVRAIDNAKKSFGQKRIWVQKYEDIVLQPDKSVSAICEWLSIDYSPDLLQVPMLNSSFSTYSDGKGISKTPVGRWGKKLSEYEIGVIQKIAGEEMDETGYEKSNVSVNIFKYSMEWVKLPIAVTRAAMANKDRVGKIIPYAWRRLRLAVGL